MPSLALLGAGATEAELSINLFSGGMASHRGKKLYEDHSLNQPLTSEDHQMVYDSNNRQITSFNEWPFYWRGE